MTALRPTSRKAPAIGSLVKAVAVAFAALAGSCSRADQGGHEPMSDVPGVPVIGLHDVPHTKVGPPTAGTGKTRRRLEEALAPDSAYGGAFIHGDSVFVTYAGDVDGLAGELRKERVETPLFVVRVRYSRSELRAVDSEVFAVLGRVGAVGWGLAYEAECNCLLLRGGELSGEHLAELRSIFGSRVCLEVAGAPPLGGC